MPDIYHPPVKLTVIEDAFSRELVRAAEVGFPGPEWQHWYRYSDKHSRKFGTKGAIPFPRACQILCEEMARLPVDAHLGLEGVFPDLELHGAGMHGMTRGDYLFRHLDAKYHPIMPWRRRVSAVLFLNEEWDAERWHGGLRVGEQIIQPKANTLVMFETTDDSWHSVVSPIECPEGMMRKTLALFWWSLMEPGESKGESTVARFSRL